MESKGPRLTREKFVIVVSVNAIKTILGCVLASTESGRIGSFARRSIQTNKGSVSSVMANRPETSGCEMGYPEVDVRLAPIDKLDIYRELKPGTRCLPDVPRSAAQSSPTNRSA